MKDEIVLGTAVIAGVYMRAEMAYSDDDRCHKPNGEAHPLGNGPVPTGRYGCNIALSMKHIDENGALTSNECKITVDPEVFKKIMSAPSPYICKIVMEVDSESE